MPEQLIRRLKYLGPFYFFGNPGNLGDLLIAEATRQFFRRHDIPYMEYDPSNLPDEYNLVYGGGGRFVSYWADVDECIELLTDPRIKNCIVLPHSFRDVDRLVSRFDERHTLYCRDKLSYDYLKEKAPRSAVLLLADMALQFNPDELTPLRVPALLSPEERDIAEAIEMGLFRRMCKGVYRASVKGRGKMKGKRVAFLLRADKEKSSELDASVSFDIAVVWGTTGRETAYSAELLRQYMKALCQVDVVVSDRLHVCIMAYICGLEVYMVDNIYGKLSGVYDLALKDCAQCHLLRDGVLPADLKEAWERISAAMRRRQKRGLRRRRRKEMMKRWGARLKEMGRAILRNLFRC